LSHKVAGLFDPPGRLQQIKDNARRLGRPRSAFDVVTQSLELIGVRAEHPTPAAAR
jgi:UDP-N-acetylglucosamine:LPS N-acetylglucosamine transferase